MKTILVPINQHDTITATIVAPPATVFEAPGLRNFSLGAWTVTDTPHQTTATSAATTDPLQFYTHFSDNPGDYSSAEPLLIELSFYNGSSLVEG